MKIHNEISLHKPPLFPPIHADEDPIGYLIRLTEINKYDSFLWLINRKKNSSNFGFSSLSMSSLLLTNSSWVRGHKMIAITKEIYNLPVNAFITKKLRYCPICLAEKLYYRIQWRLKSSIVCLKHEVLLHDRCPQCNSIIAFSKNSLGKCQCGGILNSASPIVANSDLIGLQRFIEYADFSAVQKADLFEHRPLIDSNLKDRLDLLHFFVRWSPTCIKENKLRGSRTYIFSDFNLLVACLQEVTTALFTGKEGFYYYLDALNRLPMEHHSKEEPFVCFYKMLYRRYSSDFIKPFKLILEEYIGKFWSRPISRRNTLFNDSVRIDHPWIPLKQACSEFGVHPSILKRAIMDGLIEVIDEQKKKRKFRLLYRPSIEKNIEILRRNITFIETTYHLGITRNQLRDLLAENHFPSAIPPKDSYSQSWQFPQDEVEAYLNQLFGYIQSTEKETVSIADAMRIIGNRIDRSLPSLIQAVLDNRLPLVVVNLNLRSIKGLGVPLESLRKWIHSLTKECLEYITIPEFADKSGINQEFAYQLVNNRLIEYELMGNTRFITQKHIDTFHEKYILLSHYAKVKGISSRYLVNRLTKQGIFSVDHEWDKKLRQKVYFRRKI